MDMNSPLGKQILALVRKADYAHAGEKEAIDLVFKNIPKDPRRLLLDVGCGRGKTAQYIQSKGWGKVTGIDIDAESIDYAKRAYPQVQFMVANVMDLAKIFTLQFDLIYLFNVFYALANQEQVLKQLRAVSCENSQLIIFDYLLKTPDRQNFPFPEWNPLDFSVMQSLFSSGGWCIVRTDDVSTLYEKWYKVLVSRIEEKSKEIVALAGKEWFDFTRTFYGKILEALQKNLLGGAIVYADKK
jgi:SAM-dependent methyltransferase